MAAAHTSRPSATLVAMAALLAALALALAAAPASASHLNYYKGKGCTGGILATCYDGVRCGVPNGAASYDFLYLPNWKGYLFSNPTCAGSPSSVISGDVLCNNRIGFQCIKITDSSPISPKEAIDQP